MNNPLFWPARWKIKRALRNYSIYTPPVSFKEGLIPPNLARLNFDYFMNTKEERLIQFKDWMLTNFDIELNRDPPGITKFSNWYNKYAGCFICDAIDSDKSYFDYFPTWESAYAGNNIIFDSGLFAGEYIISRRSDLHWMIYKGHPSDPNTLYHAGISRPIVGGFFHGQVCDFITLSYQIARNEHDRQEIFSRSRPEKSDGMLPHIKSALHLARMRERPENNKIGDYTNEPL